MMLNMKNYLLSSRLRGEKFEINLFLAVGIWQCSRTGKKVAGGAWEPHTQNYAVVAMGIRRLRENVES